VRSVVTEVQAKAGQKCTAIRRVIVPNALVEPVIDAIAQRLDDGFGPVDADDIDAERGELTGQRGAEAAEPDDDDSTVLGHRRRVAGEERAGLRTPRDVGVIHGRILSGGGRQAGRLSR